MSWLQDTNKDVISTKDDAWYVIHVRPRCEKKMHTYLDNRQIVNYLPLRKECKIYQRRKVQVEKPLFPGYIFSQFATSRREDVFRSKLVVRILDVADQLRLLRELEQIRRALETNPFITACPALERGMSVRIIAGPMQGVEGVVSSIKKTCRVILNVASIGQGVVVEIDAAALERI